MYHRVLPKHEAIKKQIEPGMFVTPDTFEMHLHYLQQHFNPVSLSHKIFNGSGNSGYPKPLCILTFDDGWFDFYNFAFPLLKAHNMPATVFLPTRYIGTDKWFWTDKISYLFAKRPNRFPDNLTNFEKENSLVDKLTHLKGSLESQIDAAIHLLKPLNRKKIDNIIKDLSSLWGIETNPSGPSFLSWDQVREMVGSGLITFGSHTADHNILTTLSEDEVGLELLESKEKLLTEQVVDPSFITFCYPNGNHDHNLAKMVEVSGYSLAVTTKNGWNGFSDDPFTLKRVSVHQDMTSTQAMFAYRISGMI